MIIYNKMYCQTHREQIRFVCRADNCYFQPLCMTCQLGHSQKHKTTDILPISRAIQLASNNLQRQKDALNDILQPFAKRKALAKQIQQQKKQLRKERDRLVNYIDDFIEQEINALNRENRDVGFSNNQKQFQQQLQEKIAEIKGLLDNYKSKAPVLQKALNFQVEKFMQSLGRNRSSLYGTSNFKYYSSLTHEIMLSRLQLTSESSTSKPFRKIMNESPLYFLIDPNYNTSNYLFNFNHRKQQLELYNVLDQEWIFSHNDFQIGEQGSGVHDPVTNRFYWIGGIQGGRKSNNVTVFSLNQPQKEKRWMQFRLKIARSSCMATLIKTNDINDRQKRAILVVGGVSEREEVLKSCELIDLDTHQVYSFGQANFAVFSGSLVVFNNSTILRLGGLSKNKRDYSVVEVVEKLDFQDAYLQFQREGKQPRWSYIQLQLPKGQYLSKPKLFYANQASIQINPNEVFIFGGLDAGLKGAAQSYLLGMEQFTTHSRQVRQRNASKQQRYSVRWVNEKPLITGDDFGGLKPTIWKERLYTFQNMGSGQIVAQQKRLLEFDMYQWYETDNVLPQ